MAENQVVFPSAQCISATELVDQIVNSKRNDRRFCFILGSGASVESNIPTGNRLEMIWMNCLMGKASDEYDGTPPMSADTTRLRASRMATDKEQGLISSLMLENKFADIENAWKEACENGETSLDSRYYFDIYKLRFYPFISDGFRYLEKIMEGADPSLGYHTLALLLAEDCGNNLVITTNFDTLVEDSLYLYTSKKPLVINHDLLAHYIDHTKLSRPIIAKLHHGLFFDPMNTDDVSDDWINAWSDVLAEVFRNYIPIVIGYGGGDTSLMRILNNDSISMKNGILWCTRDECGYDSQNPNVRNLVKRRNGYFVHIQGFDDLMLRIGNTLFPNEISVKGTKSLLESRKNRIMQSYQDKYTTLIVNNNAYGNIDSLPPQDLLFIADILYAKGDIDTAIKYYEKNVNYVSGLRLALVWRSLEKYANAIDVYSQLIQQEDEENNNFLFFKRGETYTLMGDHKRACDDYSKVIELDPHDSTAYNYRGDAWNELKEYEKALTDSAIAIDLDPFYAEAYDTRGSAWVGMKEYGKAIDDYSKAIELDPTVIHFYLNRAIAYDALNQPDLAKADRKKADELEGKTT